MLTLCRIPHKVAQPNRRVQGRLQGGDTATTIRLLVTGYVVAFGVDDVFLRNANLAPWGTATAVGHTFLAVLAIVAMLWRPRLGVLITAVALIVATGSATAEDALLFAIVPAVVAAGPRTRAGGALLVGMLGFAAVHSAMSPDAWRRFGALALMLVASVAVGLLIERLVLTRERGLERARSLAVENARIRVEERARLAKDLREITTGALARLQATSREVEQVREPVLLAEALDGQADVARGCLAELRVMLRFLREHPLPSQADADVPVDDAKRAVHARVLASGALFLPIIARLTDAADPTSAATALCFTAALLLLWLPTWWLAGAVTSLLVGVLVPASVSASATLLVVLTVTVVVRHDSPRLAGAVLAVVSLSVALTATRPSTRLEAYVLLTAFVVSAALSLGARSFTQARRTTKERIRRLEAERASALTAERLRLARELHDVIAHQLSVVTLQSVAHGESRDMHELRAAHHAVQRATAAAATDLRTVVAMLGADARDGHEAALGGEGGDDLAHVTRTAMTLARELRDAGHGVVTDIPASADRLDAVTRRPLVRIMQEATTNILRYAGPGECRFTVTVNDAYARLVVVSPLSSARPVVSDLSSGWGLRGIRERAELTGGRFAAGPNGTTWRVAVELPRVAK